MSALPDGTSIHRTMAETAAPLFTPFDLGEMTLPNRIIMAPMTREHSPDGVPGPDVASYYARRAAGGVGLIITEGTLVNHPAAGRSTNVPRFYGTDALDGWARIVEGVHAQGGRIMPQLWHVGHDRQPGEGFHPDERSIGPGGTPHARAMTAADMEQVITAFADAAATARQLGFDGIELHGAHGYLLDQFLWKETNNRTDDYGGTPIGRAKFPAEIVKACRDAIGPGMPIVFRMSQWKVTDFAARVAAGPEELRDLLNPLAAAGADAFHCSTRRFWKPAFDGISLSLAGWVRHLLGVPVIAVGSVGLDGDFLDALVHGSNAPVSGLEQIAGMVCRGEVDLVAVGRALLQDPDWATKVRDGRADELTEFKASALATLA